MTDRTATGLAPAAMPGPAATLSPVATLCLAILHHGEATGYEIRKASVEGDYRHFVDASYGAIYPALARLVADGFVTQREVVQSGRPSRKVHEITQAGRAALVAALSEPPGDDAFRSPFLLVAKFAAHLPPAAIATAIDKRRQRLAADAAHLDDLSTRVEDAAGQWIVGYGRACVAASIAHLDAHADALLALAGTAAPALAAAE